MAFPVPVRPAVLHRWRSGALMAAGALLAVGYTVEAGDTLRDVAARTGSTVAELARASDEADPDHLVIGTQLAVPTADGDDPASDDAGRGDVAALLEDTARAHGWSPAFVKAVAWQESGWQQNRVSAAGAVGIMQVLPGTAEFVSERLAGRPLDPHDAADNVTAGVLFLDYLHGLTGSDAELTLAGYYQGLASVRDNGTYDDTDAYIRNVLALRDHFTSQ